MVEDDISHVLDALGGDGNYKRLGEHVQCSCVASRWTHDSGQDRGQKMGVLLTDGTTLVHCFYPDCFGGNLQQLVEKVGRLRVGEGEMTLEQLSQLRAFVTLAEEDGETDARPRKKAQTLGLPAELLDALTRGSPYWRGRGVSGKDLGEWKGRAWYVLAKDAKGTPVAAQGRLLGDEDDDGHDEKYRTLPAGFQKGEHLAGAWAVPANCRQLLVVESPMDARLMAQWLDADEFGAVATMGADWSTAQAGQLLDLLARGGELVVGFDTDPAGRVGQRTLIQWAAPRVGRVSEARWPAKDPSESTESGALAAMDERTPWLVHRLRRLLT